MPRDPRYDILFEPVEIGPVTARNRFYQVPHCNGMGFRWPRSMAAMRAMKAEGGWAVVCTEECEIHPTSDLSGFALMRLWDDSDLPTHELMVEGVHAHGALAGIQLVHNGLSSPNRMSRLAPLGPSPMVIKDIDPIQARAMDKSDIRDLRRWHREAALRAKRAGYDIVYVYAAHDMTLLMHFLLSRYNQRTDEYGGSLKNRVRLIREILEETKEAVGDTCAVAFRFAVHEVGGDLAYDGEGREVVDMLAELPDLWDVNVSAWEDDSLTSRFGPQGSQEDFVAFVKQITTKPVVGVGRFTSPDAMVSQIRRGVLDLIGAARPSIADPFLPRKIEEGRIEDIRECIGCNICTTADYLAVPMRCTQNPTMGEEWRRGWHPERIPAAGSDDAVLMVGAGPAGLECALALADRGYRVTLAEARAELGGRVLLESRLPGLAEWRRVIDHRLYRLSQKANVETYPASRLSADDILDFGFPRVVLATGARWRADAVGRANRLPIPIADDATMISPDAILTGAPLDGLAPKSRLLVYDDDLYYLAGVIAEKLVADGHEVVFATPAPEVSPWTHGTLEQAKIQARLLTLGIDVRCARSLAAVANGAATLACVYTGARESLAIDAVVPVTARLPNDALHQALTARADDLARAGIRSVTAIGDCHAPATIAAAVHAGHLYARQLDAPDPGPIGFRRENDWGIGAARNTAANGS